MREEKNGLSETIQKGQAAANTVRGAVKTGKAIAGAAKGASVGGVAGAAIGLAWENRKVIIAIIIGTIVLLLLPAVIIGMLPTLIFGGLNQSDALNNPSAVTQNIEDLKVTVEMVLSESLDGVLAKIEDDREAYTEESTLVVNPYSEKLPEQTLELISEYCAIHSEDPQSCSKNDLEATLREHSEEFFRFEKAENENSVQSELEIVDSETGETQKQIVTRTDTQIVYTVYFNGSPFDLTEEQEALARDYAENLKNFIEYGV